MKKLLCMLMILSVLTASAGCGADKDSSQKEEISQPTSSATVTETTATTTTEPETQPETETTETTEPPTEPETESVRQIVAYGDISSYGVPGSEVKWELDMNGTLRIYGTGDMCGYDPAPGFSEIYEHRGYIKNVIIEYGVTNIGRCIFSDCTALTSVTIPESVTLIEPSAFSGCSSLKKITIPDSMTTICENAFNGTPLLTSQSGIKYADKWVVDCDDNITSARIDIGTAGFASFSIGKNVKTINIPASVKNISYCASASASGLNEVNYSGSKEEWDSINIDFGNENLTNAKLSTSNILSVLPVESKSDTLSGKCGDSVEWRLSDGTLRIYGTGDTDDYYNSSGLPDRTQAPWYDFADNVEKLIIESGVTSIGYGISEGFSNMKSAEIPDTVKNLARGSFSGCSSLRSITIPASVEFIGQDSFSFCSSLESVKFLGNTTRIGNWCFGECGDFEIYFPGTEEEWHNLYLPMANATLDMTPINYSN